VRKRAGITIGRLIAVPASILGIGFGCAGGSKAAEVRTGGIPEVTISGSVGFLAHGGALDNQRQEPDLSTSLDFSTDTEVHVLLRAQDEETGLEYGGTIELEADTSSEENSEETWLFARGGWGEVRLGDVDGAVDESSVGAADVAAGTGGIDGDVVDEIAVDAVSPSDTDVATKIRYYTPSFGGFQLGGSYTPNADDFGDSLATTDLAIANWVEGAVTYEGEAGDFALLASLVGSWAQVENRDNDTFNGEGQGEVWTYYAGATVEAFGISAGGGFGDESVGGLEKRYFNAGLGYALGPVSSSVTYGRVLRTANYPGVGEPWSVAFSADTELLPGITLAGDVAYFENDLDPAAEEPTGGDNGWIWVTRLEVAF
jgi:outer membrane protein OmpU